MTVDAVVNVFIKHDKTESSPRAALQIEPEGQRQLHVQHVALPLKTTPKPEQQHQLTDDAEPPLPHHQIINRAASPAEERQCVDLDVFSPPPPPAAAAAPLAAFLHADCVFCGSSGTPRTCGTLVGVKLGEQRTAVHHACALWAPQVYQPQGCDDYLNLETEWRHSQHRRCAICGNLGAAVTCTHAGCRAAFHLPCAALASDVVLDKTSFELWCPKHAVLDSDEEEEECGSAFEQYNGRQYRGNHRGSGKLADEDFAPGNASRPRRNAALSRKHRFQRGPANSTDSRERAATAAAMAAAALAVSDRAQRPRTDWQRQGDTWVKVVPPWWCEHRTIHFANKVFRELFCSASSAILVDSDGIEWDCLVSCETRNDHRLQYTLRGQFHEYWDSAGVKAGDVLTFERNKPRDGRIQVGRYPQGRGLEEVLGVAAATTEATASMSAEIHQAPVAVPVVLLDPSSSTIITRLPRAATAAAAAAAVLGPVHLTRRDPPSNSSQSHHQQQGHPNRWTELSDGSAAKTVYKSTLVHQQCPIAGWLYRKLYGRVPAETDAAAMHDPSLGADFHFEVSFVPAANVHYINGRIFGTWMKDAGVRSGDQIRIWRDKVGVKICRMAAGAGNGVLPLRRSSSSSQSVVDTDMYDTLPTAPPSFSHPPHPPTTTTAAVQRSLFAAVPPPLLASFLSPPSAEALGSLNALAAAAGYAGQHGTPAIQAVLAHAAELRAQGAAAAKQLMDENLKERLEAAGVPPPPSPFLRKRKASTSLDVGNDQLGAAAARPLFPANKSFASSAAASGALPAPIALYNRQHQASSSMPPRPLQGRQSPPHPATVGAAPPPAAAVPNQLQFQQALQQLIRNYHANSQQQQQQTGGGGVTSAPLGAAPPPVPTFFRSSQPPQNKLSSSQAVSTLPGAPPPFQYRANSTGTANTASFAAVTTALARQQWSSEESTLLMQFRVKCAVLDAGGREVAFANLLQLQNDKRALLEMVRGVVNSGHVSSAAAPVNPPPAPTAAADETEDDIIDIEN